MTVFGDGAFKEVTKLNEVFRAECNPVKLGSLYEEAIRTQTHRGRTI